MNTKTRILIVDDDDIVRQGCPKSLVCVHASCDVAAARAVLDSDQALPRSE